VSKDAVGFEMAVAFQLTVNCAVTMMSEAETVHCP
jgi:hypothetical protein